jgi:hypothetical protein
MNINGSPAFQWSSVTHTAGLRGPLHVDMCDGARNVRESKKIFKWNWREKPKVYNHDPEINIIITSRVRFKVGERKLVSYLN